MVLPPTSSSGNLHLLSTLRRAGNIKIYCELLIHVYALKSIQKLVRLKCLNDYLFSNIGYALSRH